MTRSRVRTSQSVSLFPFLAVLVCAMGALILLLIVTTRRIRREAVARAAIVKPQPAKPKYERLKPELPVVRVQPAIPRLHEPIAAAAETDRIIAAHLASIRRKNETLQATVRQLKSQRIAALQQFEKLSQERKSAAERLRNARSQLVQLESARAKLDQRSATERAELQRLEQQIQSSATDVERYRRELSQLKLQAAQASSQFAIVPFDGRSGTTRRPLFIECTKDALRFLPEDITISAQDLQGFTVEYNPVLAGARSLVHHWATQKRNDSTGKEPDPYVLLLVRPGGSIAYYAARKMLGELGQPIGYELIDPDWKLAMPAADPQAKAVCQRAVNRVLAERRRAVESVRSGRPGSERSGRGSGSFLGSESAGGTGSQREDTGPAGSSSRMMRFNRATGRFEVVQPNREPSLGPFGKALDDGREHASDGPGAYPQTASNHPDRFPQTANSPQQPGMQGGRQSANPAAGLQETDSAKPPAMAGQQRTAVTRNSQGGTHTTVGPPNKLDGGTGESQSGQPPNAADDPFQSPATKHDSNGHSQGRAAAEDSRNLPKTTPSPSEWQTRPNGQSASSEGSTTNADSSTSRGPSSQVLGNTGRKSQGGNSNASPTFTQKRRWGLSDRRAGIGFEREITIWSSADQLRVGKRQTIAVGQGESREELLRRVAAAVDSEARSWGKPPSSFYWVPTLRFVVSPGGNQHYERLNGGLRTIGLPSIAEQRLDTTAPPTPTR